MKKWIAFLLAVLMLAAIGAGCSGGDEDENNLPVNVGVTPPSAPQQGGDDTPQPPTPGTAVVKRQKPENDGMVAAGSVHSLGLRTDGTVISGGHDVYGQRGVKAWENVAYIAAGKTLSLGVKKDGTVVAAGSLSDGAALETVRGWNNVLMVDAGVDFAAALLEDGTVVAAGDNSSGQCDVATWSDMAAIAAGDNFLIGLKADGTIAATGAAPTDVGSWSNVVKIAAGGDRAAAITAEGKVLATVDTAVFDTSSDYTAIGIGGAGIAAVRADGSVVAKFDVVAEEDPLVFADSTNITAIANIVCVDVGERHAVVMDKKGNAFAYGENLDLQCDVSTFALRPFVEAFSSGNYLRGFEVGTTVAEAKRLIMQSFGVNAVSIVNKDGAEAADTDVVATGMNVADIGEIVILGDGDGDGAITQADVDLMDGVISYNTDLGGAYARALKLSTSKAGNAPECTAADKTTVSNAAAGSAKISQFGVKQRGTYAKDYDEAFKKNPDTVGYIAIQGTNIKYPIMFDKTGTWFYNDHTFEKEKAESGSVYTYYYGDLQNNVVTGHNSRPSGAMFHQLHHIQEFNLGKTKCDEPKYCAKELSDLPNLQIYAQRVWDVFLYGEEARYEVFSVYESGKAKDTVQKNFVWYNGYEKETEAAVKEWIDLAIEKSEIKIDTTVTAKDEFMTVFVCGNTHEESNGGSRLYFFLKKVD